LSGVSCTSATACVAVGRDGNRPLVESWNGMVWSIQDNPVPGGWLSGVSCVSATACVAVGSDGVAALVEGWDGTDWSIQNTRVPAGARNSTLRGVSCTSKTACTAVGGYASAHGTNLALVERWNGSGWSVQHTPRVGDASLAGVSCPSRRACIAVGEFYDNAMVERWSGPTRRPSPAQH
jgi:hypothetical protein